MSEKIIQLNEGIIKKELKELVRNSGGTLNELLDKEAAELTGGKNTSVQRHARGIARTPTNVTSPPLPGDVTLKVPKLKGVGFETAIIERYRRRKV